MINLNRWYGVIRDKEDFFDLGSYEEKTAIKMAKQYNTDIAVCDAVSGDFLYWLINGYDF